MGSSTYSLVGKKPPKPKKQKKKDLSATEHDSKTSKLVGDKTMSIDNGGNDDTYINDADDFDFVEAYDDAPAAADERLLPENSAASAISVGFVGVGGGGGKLAKAFLDLGFSKTLLVNTTEKISPEVWMKDTF